MSTNIKEKEKQRQKLDNSDSTNQEDEKFLILHNDDYNSFDGVIKALVDICQHSPYQAEQCALLAHHKGKCDIFKGILPVLTPMKKKLQLRGLVVSIE